MFFAGYAKEQHAKRNGNDALAKEANHNALPQLSVSGLARKDESAGMPSLVIRVLSFHCSARHSVNARSS
jgi:hypothetical protein